MDWKYSDITWVNFDQSTAASHEVVSATTAAGKKVILCGAVLLCAAAVSLTFEDADGTNITGAMPAGANGGFVLPTNPLGYGKPTVISRGLFLLLSGAFQVGGTIGYRLVD